MIVSDEEEGEYDYVDHKKRKTTSFSPFLRLLLTVHLIVNDINLFSDHMNNL
ncbi:hypothetical protein [Sporosarcina sp.]|uniref:hypothetical protein n=1 Tax=Sporosarcina sp. TaxID=49982 RepID=UPI0026176CC5|nr:hypothetical protein [Sporosarcina sp.]